MSHGTGLGLRPLGPAWSEDGRLAVNLASGPVKSGDWGNQIQHSEITVLDLKRKTQRTVAHLDHWQGDVGSPAWSPDDKQIVYQRQWSPISHKIGLALFVVPAKGGTARRLTPEDIAGGDHPVWSPDGKWIAFRTHADQDPGEGPTAAVADPPRRQRSSAPQDSRGRRPLVGLLTRRRVDHLRGARRRPHLRRLGDARGRLGHAPDHADDHLGLGARLGSVTAIAQSSDNRRRTNEGWTDDEGRPPLGAR